MQIDEQIVVDDKTKINPDDVLSLDERLRCFQLPSHICEFLQQDRGDDDNDNDDEIERKDDDKNEGDIKSGNDDHLDKIQPDESLFVDEMMMKQNDMNKENCTSVLSLDERLRSFKLPSHFYEFLQKDMQVDDDNDEQDAFETDDNNGYDDENKFGKHDDEIKFDFEDESDKDDKCNDDDVAPARKRRRHTSG